MEFKIIIPFTKPISKFEIKDLSSNSYEPEWHIP